MSYTLSETNPNRPSTPKELLEGKAKTIHWMEERIKELEKSLKIESSIRMKISMQQSIKINRVLLQALKDSFWREL